MIDSRIYYSGINKVPISNEGISNNGRSLEDSGILLRSEWKQTGTNEEHCTSFLTLFPQTSDDLHIS